MSEATVSPESRQFLARKHDLCLDESGPYPFEFAVLQRPKTSQWYVPFYVFSVKRNELVRKRRYVSGDSQKIKKENARKIIDEINLVLKAGGYIDPIKVLRDSGQMPLVVALDQYMKDKLLTLKEQSVTTYEKWANYFLKFLEAYELINVNLKDFNNEHAADLRTHALTVLKMGNKTYNNYKAFVSGFFIYSKPIYKLTANPISETLFNLPTKTSKHIAYNSAQINQYKAACEKLELPELWFFVRMIYYTFCRPWEEVRKMRVGHIKDDHIIIYADTSKTNHRSVMIPPALEEIFQRMECARLSTPLLYFLAWI